MNFWFWIVLILSNIYFIYLIIKLWKDRDEGEGWVKWLICPVIFPAVLFDLAFFAEGTYIPILVSLTPSTTLLVYFFALTAISVIFSLVIYASNSSQRIQLSPEVMAEALMSSHKFWLAVMYSAAKAIQAGWSEEIWCRFFSLIAIQRLILFLTPAFVSGLALSLPGNSWLMLWMGPLVSPAVLITLFLVNFVFAGLHVIDPGTLMPAWRLLPRMIGAWFMAWILSLALIQTGIVGAIFFHYLADLLIFVPIIYLEFKNISKNGV